MKTLLAAFSLLIAVNANAFLIEKDYISFGDNLILYDTDTGLEWLDHTVTLGISADAILKGAGGFLDQGFFWTTMDQIKLLTNHAGFATLNYISAEDAYGAGDGAGPFQSQIIAFMDIYSGGEGIHGYHTPRIVHDYWHGGGYECTDEYRDCEARSPFFNGVSNIYADGVGGNRYLSHTGDTDRFYAGAFGTSHFLAKWSAEVPEPGTLGLLASGLFLLWLRRKA